MPRPCSRHFYHGFGVVVAFAESDGGSVTFMVESSFSSVWVSAGGSDIFGYFNTCVEINLHANMTGGKI